MEEENRLLKERIKYLEEKIARAEEPTTLRTYNSGITQLSSSQINRYGRQLLIPNIGVQSQIALCRSKVLVIGAGGLGCPVALYLAGAGVGKIGLVDYDFVETSNLHRQVAHTERACIEKTPKVISLRNSIFQLNSSIQVQTHHTLLTSENSLSVLSDYDVIVDASDNVATRYLVNDSCVLLKKPLVFGSALRWDGQATVYNYKGGPCYRCIFPIPPPPETVGSCSDNGVLGPVTGIIGSVQALETIKILTGSGSTLSSKLLIFDGASMTFRTVKLRDRVKTCALCGDQPSILTLQDYPSFCQSPYSDKYEDIDQEPEVQLERKNNVSCVDYSNELKTSSNNSNNNNNYNNNNNNNGITNEKNHLLLDVRESHQYDICHIANSVNIPLAKLESKLDEVKALIQHSKLDHDPLPIYVICRRGIDSRWATKMLLDHNFKNVKNIEGGLVRWTKDVDPSFPVY